MWWRHCCVVAAGLIQRGYKYEAMAIFAVASGVASLACLALTVETAGRTLGEGMSTQAFSVFKQRVPFARMRDSDE